MSSEVVQTGDIVPGLIVRHTSRRLGRLGICESCERLVSGKISFSEFVDQVGDGYRDILDFMLEHDLHPGRPEDVLFCIDCHAEEVDREALLAQLGEIYSYERRSRAG